MMLLVRVPSVGESIQEVVLGKWLKKEGEFVQRDEPIAEFESEKSTLQVNAEQSGVLHTQVEEGASVKIGDVIGSIDPSAVQGSAAAPVSVPAGFPGEQPPPEQGLQKPLSPVVGFEPAQPLQRKATPLASKMLDSEQIPVQQVSPAKPDGKIYQSDVLAHLQSHSSVPATPTPTRTFSRQQTEQRVTQLRKVISRRLVEAKNVTAMLTTFNEVDMSAVLQIRTDHKEAFKRKHDVNLGFMSFFVKASCIALKEFPSVNAYFGEDTITLHEYCDVSVAVSTPRGLVVPVIRNAESLSMADIEKTVANLATKAREGKLSMEEMTGGTFTITNGGVFGSLLSTPIINLPQSAILGMHKIEQRPVAVQGKVEIRPMMYLALSYDHRIIDGKESVGFLVRVKELLENPALLYTEKNPVISLLDISG